MSDSLAGATANQLNQQAIQQVPVGVVSPNESTDPTAILQSAVPVNGGLYVSMGADIFCSYQLTKEIQIAGTYSYLSKPLTHYDQPFLNFFPYHKTNLSLKYNDAVSGIFAELRHRWQDSYFTGDVPPFFLEVPATHLIDLTVGYTIPSYTKLQFVLSVSNLLNHQFVSLAGTPAIGRLTTLRAHYTL
jgi:outer membrane receptor protein involved in Fe transport